MRRLRGAGSSKATVHSFVPDLLQRLSCAIVFVVLCGGRGRQIIRASVDMSGTTMRFLSPGDPANRTCAFWPTLGRSNRRVVMRQVRKSKMAPARACGEVPIMGIS